MYYSKCYK